MQNNLATDIIKNLKNKIKILFALLITMSIISLVLSVACISKNLPRNCCQNDLKKTKSVFNSSKTANEITIFEKRRTGDGKIYTIQSKSYRKPGGRLYNKSNI